MSVILCKIGVVKIRSGIKVSLPKVVGVPQVEPGLKCVQYVVLISNTLHSECRWD